MGRGGGNGGLRGVVKRCGGEAGKGWLLLFWFWLWEGGEGGKAGAVGARVVA